MGCIVAMLALASPHLVLLLVVVFNWDYLFRLITPHSCRYLALSSFH